MTALSSCINSKMMLVFGFYPCEKHVNLQQLWIYGLYFLSMTPVLVFGPPKFVSGFTQKELNDAFVLMGIISYVPKILPCIFNRYKIRKCIHYFDGQHQPEEHEKILRNWTEIYQRNYRLYTVGIIGGVSSVIIGNTLRGELPLNVWLPFDTNSRTMWYWCMHFLLALGLSYSCICCAFIDPLIGGLVGYATGQLQVLKCKLERLEEAIARTELKERILYERVKECLVHYQAVTDFVRLCEECYSPVVFVQFMASGVNISFCCLQLIHLRVKDYPAWIHMMTLLLLQILFYCYYGTLLLEENDSINNAICMGKWYDYDIQSKKALIILMERSKKKLLLTGGKIFSLHLDTFMLVLKKAYSFVAVLKSYY